MGRVSPPPPRGKGARSVFLGAGSQPPLLGNRHAALSASEAEKGPAVLPLSPGVAGNRRFLQTPPLGLAGFISVRGDISLVRGWKGPLKSLAALHGSKH